MTAIPNNLRVRVPRGTLRGLHPASKEYCTIVRNAIVATLTQEHRAPLAEAKRFAARWYADRVHNLRHPDIDGPLSTYTGGM